MIVNLMQLREERSVPPAAEFETGDIRRLNPLSIEQQKKRAKELLRAVRSNDADAAERFRRHSPDSLSSQSGPRLSDAQHVIARETGFRKWTDLKTHTDRIRIAQQVTLEGRPSALDRGTRTLHIRCGHDIMHKLAVAGFEGDFLWFADPYVQGPVPRTASLEEFVRIRAHYLDGQRGAGDSFEALLSSYRDLEKAREYEVVNIWMEHDSYDQLVLAKLLDFFSDPQKRPPRLRLISVTRFPGVERFIGIGQLPPEALRVLWNDFEDVNERQFLLGKHAWAALTAPTPEALLEIVNTGTPALPTMAKALARHLRELPSVSNGLSLTEELTLRILRDKGAMSAPRLFGWYTNHYEPLPFLGDTGYWSVLRVLADAREPAIRIDERSDAPKEWHRNWHVELLPFGERLLRNDADWLKANTVERWVGGVHVDSRAPARWRFDEERECVIRDS